MYKNPFFVSPATQVTKANAQNVWASMRAVGVNTGNMLFAYALQNVLAPGGRPASGFSFDPLQDKSGHDCLVFAAANWLQPNANLTTYIN